MEFKDFLHELKKLNLPTDQYCIFGSGALAIRNIRQANDLDIIVTQQLWDELAKKYQVTEKDGIEKMEMGNIEIYLSKDVGWESIVDNPDVFITDSDTIDGFPYLKLEYLRKWKKNKGRDKDLKDIELIDAYQESTQS